jgi:polysaccharide deacetylase family protein (PEP-CTERM system associated)
MVGPGSVRNALTVDVEDWFQVSNLDSVVRRAEWERYPSRVTGNTRRLLDLFEAHRVKATFFVLGWVAERRPDLVGEIAGAGHEVACHGYGHDLVYSLGRRGFEQDLDRSVAAIEAAAGVRPRGYRAPSFSIDHRSLWAFEVLVDRGFTYDSSVYPVRHPRYGIPSFPRVPRRVRTAAGEEIREFPMTTLRILGGNIGASGGGYLRLLPLAVVETAFARMNGAGHPAVLYVHPWEVDPEQPRLKPKGLGRITHYANLARTEGRLGRLLRRFDFGTMEESLAAASTLEIEPIEVGTCAGA